MAGNQGGITDFTGIRVGSGNLIPGLSGSDASAGVGKVWCSARTVALVALPTTAAGSTITTVSFPGAASGDLAYWGATSSMSSGVGNLGAYVSAANVVTIVLSNSSTAAQTIAAQTITVVVERYAYS